MELLINWIKPIIYFSIFITVMLQLLPADKYSKYIRFFAGLLMIVMVVGPVFRLFGAEELSLQRFTDDFLSEQSVNIDLDIGKLEGESEAYYEAWIAEQLEEMDNQQP